MEHTFFLKKSKSIMVERDPSFITMLQTMSALQPSSMLKRGLSHGVLQTGRRHRSECSSATVTWFVNTVGGFA
jgi:hypothetical protein